MKGNLTAATNKLRLAVFNTQPPLFLGGVERRILEMAKHLNDYITTTVYSGTKAGLRKVTHLNNLTVVPCFSTDKIFPLDNWTFNQTLYRNANNLKADVYEAHTASGYGLLNAFQRHNLRVPFVQTIHGVLADEYAQAALRGGLTYRQKLANILMWQLAKREEEAAKKATLIVTISHYSKKKILQYYDVDPAKIRLVPNGVDTTRFTPIGEYKQIKQYTSLNNPQIILFVGRLIPRKGVGYLIEAAKQVIKERKNTLFVLVGNGPLRSQLTSDVIAAGLKPNFAFLGDVSEDDLPKLYRYADVFAFPSLQEGQGIVLLEAQASATPVVAFKVSGVIEAVRDKETGVLVEPAVDTLVEAILKLLSDSSLREKMGAQGREFILKEFSWSINAKKMLDAYCEAVNIF